MLRRHASLFFFLEGIACIVWWILLYVSPSFRAWFIADGSPESTLMALVAGDLILFAGGALVTAYAIRRRFVWMPVALFLHAGAAVYGALYAVTLALCHHGSLLGAALMLPSLTITPYYVGICAKEWTS